MSTIETKPGLLNRNFYFGAFAGIILTSLIAIAIVTITDPPEPISDACTIIPTDENFVRRIGTAEPRTGDETILFDRMTHDYKRRFERTAEGATDEHFKEGGVLSRCALVAIIKSLEEKQDSVYYRLGLDERGRTVVLLKGGVKNPFQTNGEDLKQPLILYNGISEECFCPVHCGNWSGM